MTRSLSLYALFAIRHFFLLVSLRLFFFETVVAQQHYYPLLDAISPRYWTYMPASLNQVVVDATSDLTNSGPLGIPYCRH